MIARCKQPSLFLTALLVGACTFVPARADERDYLPSGTNVFYHLEIAKMLKGKVFQDAAKKLPGYEEALPKLTERWGVAPTNMARVSMGYSGGSKFGCEVITTIKPVTAAEIKAARKPRPYQANFMYEETKIGDHTVFQEKFSYKFGDKVDDKVQHGKAFCVVEGKYVVISNKVDNFKKVLESKRQAIFSPVMQTALKVPVASSVAANVVELQELGERELMAKSLEKLTPGLPAVFPNIYTMTILIQEEKEQVKASVILNCKDAASAAEVKKVVETGLGELKKISEKPKGSFGPEIELKVLLTAFTDLNNIQISAKDAQVIATAPITPRSLLLAVLNSGGVSVNTEPRGGTKK